MNFSQKLLEWLREQPLFLVFKNSRALAGADRVSTLALIATPVLAAVVLVGGGIGVALAASTDPQTDTPDSAATASSTSQTTEIAEQAEIDGEPPAEGDSELETLEVAIAQWGQPDFAAILTEEFPGSQWSLNGDTYAGLIWIGPGQKPSEVELLSLWAKVGKALSDRQNLAQEEAEAQALREKTAAEARAADPSRQELCNSIDYKALYGPGVDYSKVLSVHYPGSQWSLNGSAYSGLTWISPGTRPTQATLDGLWDGVAFQLCLQKPLSELKARAGTSETEEYVDGVVRPKGFSDGTFTPSLQNCNTLPQVPSDGGGGTVQIYNDPSGGQNFEQVIGMGLGDFACRLAESHGWFGNQYSMGIGVDGERTVRWYSSQVDTNKVRSLLSSLGAVLSPPSEPEPDQEGAVLSPPSEPEPDQEEAPE
jgi:hypothetical protein